MRVSGSTTMGPRSLSVALALSCACLAGCAVEGASAPRGPEILELSQGTFTSNDHPLQVERKDEARVLDLRLRENLDRVVAGARGEMEIFKRLTVWARKQFEPGFPDPHPLCNGLSILDDIRAGKTHGFCGQYSYLLGDALKSFGFVAVRYVELESTEGAGHFAVEVWCNDLNRWLVLDPLHAALYQRDGVPLSAIEVHDALISGQTDAVRVERLSHETRSAARETGASDKDLLSVFYNVAISTRNDFARLEKPLSIAEREVIFLRYADPRAGPFRNLKPALASARKDDFLTPMNQIAIETRAESGKPYLHVSFATRGTCPHLVRYRIRVDEGPWKDSGPLLRWHLAAGENRLEVRAVNAFEVEGPVFRLRVAS